MESTIVSTYQADVVVVGSGIAGSLLADRLARSGLTVLILEAGSRMRREEIVRRYQTATPDSRWEYAYPEAPHAPRPKGPDYADYYVQEGPDLFTSTYLRCVGGTTWRWLGSALRLRPPDFEMRTRYGLALDWPLRYADLEPWYCMAETELGVSGDNANREGPPRSRPFPLPEVPQSYSDLSIRRATESLGIRVTPTPAARNSTAYDDRPACCGSSTCTPICPTGAKYDAATVHVSKAVKAGARLLEDSVAFRLELDSSGRVERICTKRPDGSQESVTAQMFVLAAHAIETPKLLLASRSNRMSAGVANSSGQVGRNLMDHPTTVSWGLARDPVYAYRGPLSTSGIEQFSDGPWRKHRGAFRSELRNDGWRWVEMPLQTLSRMIGQGMRGDALKKNLNRHVNRRVSITSLCEQLPDQENRVEPSFEHLDPLGIPRPRIFYRIGAYTTGAAQAARVVHSTIMQSLQAEQVGHLSGLGGAGHIMGTCRMGLDGKRSVTDSYGQTHDHPNLYVLGSALFPTSGTANPTLTLAALTLRTADHLARILCSTI